MKFLLASTVFCMFFSLTPSNAQSLYFPPLSGDQWETIRPESLGWCADSINALYQYLDAEESKAFIILKDGKIVLEKYFDQFSKDSLWYWASAGKTLTAFLTGIAQSESKLKLSDSVSKYLGSDWTDCSPEQEQKITISNLLTMTSGLDDGVSDNHCTKPECLIYKTDPGKRWAYHNAPYTLIRDVLEQATGMNENLYIQSKLKSKTGMNGLWITSGYDNVYLSNARSMARFGLLILNKGIWDSNDLLNDPFYFDEMVHPSQSINKSYGYLWWLNGQASFMLPGLQLVFPGSYCPEAPSDMFAAIGKNGQILCVVPSQNLIVLRMGEAGGLGSDDVPIVLCNQMWLRINRLNCQPVRVKENNPLSLNLIPNPAGDLLSIDNINNLYMYKINIYNHLGLKMPVSWQGQQLQLSSFQAGIYWLTIELEGRQHVYKFIKAN